jgi:hypothetical protein
MDILLRAHHGDPEEDYAQLDKHGQSNGRVLDRKENDRTTSKQAR